MSPSTNRLANSTRIYFDAPPNFGNQNRINLAVQDKKGRLFEPSLQALANWGVAVPEEFGLKLKERVPVKLAWKDDWGWLSAVPLSDVIENVADRAVDMGIVSSDAFKKWQWAEEKASVARDINMVKDIGVAGSALKFGMDKDFLNTLLPTRTTGMPDAEAAQYVWKLAVKKCCRRNRPIVTSDKQTLMAFFKKNGMPVASKNVVERRGAVEAQGRLMDAPVICDLVDSGDTMKASGYVPVKGVTIASCRLLLIGNMPPRQAPPNRRNGYVRFIRAASTYTAQA